jgi:predicted AlkP superfamily phosphohydrolase/phosphomutase
VRLNLAGREAKGVVPPDRYESVCEEIAERLLALRDGRSGRPVVRDIVRVRSDPLGPEPKGLAADLVVLWDDSAPVDVVECPWSGRIGPVPFFRSGAHDEQGFALIAGPGVTGRSRLREGTAPDLTATLLSLLGEPVPASLDGRSLLKPDVGQSPKR